MRRWRLPDGRTLAEAPSIGKFQYYLLGRTGGVERAFAETATSVEGELHRLSFVVLGQQMMRRHTVERGGGAMQDVSGIELDNLTQLTAAEEPSPAQVRESIARHTAPERAVEEERRGKVDHLAAVVGVSMRDLVRGLAERADRHHDHLARALLTSLRSLAELHRSRRGSDSLRAATEAIALAARLVSLDRDPPGRDRARPAGDEATRALIDKLDALRDQLRSAAQAAPPDPAPGSDPARAYLQAAELLRLAVHHLLLASTEPGGAA
jgi:hypothetical protein